MNILIVGGAGYIGSHMTRQLTKAGHSVVVLDNLSTGFRSLAKYGELVVGDLNDEALLEELFQKHSFDGVMHFAANSQVGESVTAPAKYYRNNVVGTMNLLDAMIRHQVLNFVFSSTAATFGNPEYVPIDEKHPQMPINPYGATKLMVERILQDYQSAYNLNSVCLRYFNACGANPEGELGECHNPETHLIPLILQAASGRRNAITVFGRDYPTDDGTCIRDYVHVEDLCSAHSLALAKLAAGQINGWAAFNLGNGSGFSVNEVIEVAKNVVAKDGKTIEVLEGERRAGDPATLVADASRAKQELGWTPVFTDLEAIIMHAWSWEKSLTNH